MNSWGQDFGDDGIVWIRYNDYVKTTSMSKKDKLKDIELMIEYFIEEERYEDCAILVGIKEDIIEH